MFFKSLLMSCWNSSSCHNWISNLISFIIWYVFLLCFGSKYNKSHISENPNFIPREISALVNEQFVYIEHFWKSWVKWSSSLSLFGRSLDSLLNTKQTANPVIRNSPWDRTSWIFKKWHSAVARRTEFSRSMHIHLLFSQTANMTEVLRRFLVCTQVVKVLPL